MAFDNPVRSDIKTFLQDAGYTDRLARGVAIAVLAMQVVQCVASAYTYVALHGDGAWFVFTLAEDQPWALKWANPPARATIYVTVVVPAELLTHWLQLSGLQI